MQTATINVGLNIGDGTRKITPAAVRSALLLAGHAVLDTAVRQSDTESTYVARIAPPLSPIKAFRIAQQLEQEAIAQRVGDTGELYGPGADKWRPFNPKYFLDLDLEPVDADVAA